MTPRLQSSKNDQGRKILLFQNLAKTRIEVMFFSILSSKRPHHDAPLEFLAAHGVGGLQVRAVQAGVHRGLPEAVDAQHGVLRGGEHDVGLSVQGALQQTNKHSSMF